MRLQAFKAKKADEKTPSSEEISPLEPPGVGGSPPGSLPGEDDEETIHTRDDPTNLETRRVDVPLVVAVDVHPPPIPPLQCDVCGQTFGEKAGLNGHMRKKHQQIEQIDGAQEIPENLPSSNMNNAVKCKNCGKICNNKCDLYNHLGKNAECFLSYNFS